MQNSKPAKTMLKYLLILAVVAATVVGVFIGTDLYPTPSQLQIDPNNPQLPRGMETIEPCLGIFLSFPPKCMTLDGEYIPVPGTSPYILVTPEGK